MQDKTCTITELLSKEGIILFGEFKLSSGKKSNVYIDLRRALSNTTLSRILSALLLAEISTYITGIDVIAGVATAGIPWATMAAAYYAKPLAYVRSKEKEHGTRRRVEGIVEGKRILLIDDVATTGSSLLEAARALREHRARVEVAAVVVDRGEGARELLAENGITLIAPLTLRDMLACLRKHDTGLTPY